MSTREELRHHCADVLAAGAERACLCKAFVGLDGFVDEIIHVVDKRDDADHYHRLATIKAFSQRLAAAAGRSTNVELVNQRVKLGGNGPIMANALARLGIKVTYAGTLGYPNLHPVFHDFAARAEVHSIAEPGHTDALEFQDGKVMLTKTAHFNQIHWANIKARVGRDLFVDRLSRSDLIGFVNWTMIPSMSDIWDALLKEVCPLFEGPRRLLFIDLADPEKRTADDIRRALNLIVRFQSHFDVIFGMNEKEAGEVGSVLELETGDPSEGGLSALALALQERVPVSNIVIHPVSYALAAAAGRVAVAQGPYIEKPLITTGAGDHFNAGYCLGKLVGLDESGSLMTGVATSGFYVRHAQGPTLEDLVAMMRNWPVPS